MGTAELDYKYYFYIEQTFDLFNLQLKEDSSISEEEDEKGIILFPIEFLI